MEQYRGLEQIIDASKIRYNEPMKQHTTVKVGGNCDCLVLPETIEEIQQILLYAKENNVKYYIIGNGSNLLVADEGVHALIIKITNKFSKIVVEGNCMTAYAGASMPLVAIAAKKHALTGFEFACGIPGTIGGGTRMNAGAYGGEMSHVFQEACYLDENANIQVITANDMNFSYRHSFFTDKSDLVILSVTIALQQGDISEITELMTKNMTARREKQPLEYPNFGSVFRRPEGYFVGKLIQDCGLRGYTIGGAQVSTKHTGFIINTGEATCQDIITLIQHIQNTVYEKFTVHLTTEVVLIGGEWK